MQLKSNKCLTRQHPQGTLTRAYGCTPRMQATEADLVRRMAAQGQRADGRKTDEVRQITCRAGVLPAVHGSALFTRGETQALAVATLGEAQGWLQLGLIREMKLESWRAASHLRHHTFSRGMTQALVGARVAGHTEAWTAGLAAVYVLWLQGTRVGFCTLVCTQCQLC